MRSGLPEQFSFLQAESVALAMAPERPLVISEFQAWRRQRQSVGDIAKNVTGGEEKWHLLAGEFCKRNEGAPCSWRDYQNVVSHLLAKHSKKTIKKSSIARRASAGLRFDELHASHKRTCIHLSATPTPSHFMQLVQKGIPFV